MIELKLKREIQKIARLEALKVWKRQRTRERRRVRELQDEDDYSGDELDEEGL